MVEIKEAVKIGEEFLKEVYENADDIMFDSADSSDKIWSVKFRVPLSVKPINSLQNALGINKRIFYKTVKIDEDGNITGVTDEDLPKAQTPEIQTETV